MENENGEASLSAPADYPPTQRAYPPPADHDALDQTQTMPAALDELPPYGSGYTAAPTPAPAGAYQQAPADPGSGIDPLATQPDQPTAMYPPVSGYTPESSAPTSYAPTSYAPTQYAQPTSYGQPPAGGYPQQQPGYAPPAAYPPAAGYQPTPNYQSAPGGYQPPPNYQPAQSYQPTQSYQPAQGGYAPVGYGDTAASYGPGSAYGQAYQAPYPAVPAAESAYGYGQPQPVAAPGYGPTPNAPTPGATTSPGGRSKKKSHVGLWTLLVVGLIVVIIAAATFIIKPSFLFKKVLDHAAVERTIEQQSGGLLTSVSCPANEKVKAGVTFQCTAANNKKVTVKVKDSQANYEWSLTT